MRPAAGRHAKHQVSDTNDGARRDTAATAGRSHARVVPFREGGHVARFVAAHLDVLQTFASSFSLFASSMTFWAICGGTSS
jgi:hypothetical protein